MQKLENSVDDDDESNASAIFEETAPEMEKVPSRWQRVRRHPAYRPVTLLIGVGLAIGAYALVVSPDETEDVDEDSSTEVQNQNNEAQIKGVQVLWNRKSPIEHTVGLHERRQSFGPAREHEKVIQINPYTRGGNNLEV